MSVVLWSQGGFTPLYVASHNGHSQVAELLLSKGADVNLSNQVQYVLEYSKCYKYSNNQTLLGKRRSNNAVKVANVIY